MLIKQDILNGNYFYDCDRLYLIAHEAGLTANKQVLHLPINAILIFTNR